jgi:hypothetical protein
MGYAVTPRNRPKDNPEKFERLPASTRSGNRPSNESKSVYASFSELRQTIKQRHDEMITRAGYRLVVIYLSGHPCRRRLLALNLVQITFFISVRVSFGSNQPQSTPNRLYLLACCQEIASGEDSCASKTGTQVTKMAHLEFPYLYHFWETQGDLIWNLTKELIRMLHLKSQDPPSEIGAPGHDEDTCPSSKSTQRNRFHCAIFWF